MRVPYDQLTDEQIRSADVIAVVDPQTLAGQTVYNGPARGRQYPAGPYAVQIVEIELARDDARHQDLRRRVAAIKKIQRDESASELAKKHFQVEPGLTRVIPFSGSQTFELPTAEPIKLLEVNTNTVPTGIMPLGFGPAPEAGIRLPSVIIEVTPDEFEKIEAKEMPLPKGWEFRQREILRELDAVESK